MIPWPSDETKHSCRITDIGSIYHTVCLLTSQLSSVVSYCLVTGATGIKNMEKSGKNPTPSISRYDILGDIYRTTTIKQKPEFLSRKQTARFGYICITNCNTDKIQEQQEIIIIY